MYVRVHTDFKVGVEKMARKIDRKRRWTELGVRVRNRNEVKIEKKG